MNGAEDSFRELLTDAPFDDSYRGAHRDEARERALRAFDDAATAGVIALGLGHSSLRQSFRRRAVRIAAISAVAASLCGALITWHERSGTASSPGKSADPIAASQFKALALADQKLVAALNLLSDFDDDRADATFDRGVQACLGEHYSQIASLGEGPLETRDQQN